MPKRKAKGKVEEIVLDCSIAAAWCFHDEADPYADAVAGRFPGVQAIVPAIWPLEVANALLMGERRKRSTEADTASWLGFLSTLPIMVAEEVNRAWSDVLALARAHGLSAYDAAYLELALRRGLPMATLDRGLRKALQAAGGSLYMAS